MKNKQCTCRYTKRGRLFGLCLRCAKRDMKAFDDGRKWAFKKILIENKKLIKKWV